MSIAYIDIVFDGPPGPVGPRFVEVEDDTGKSIRIGEWMKRPDGYWALRIQQPPGAPADAPTGPDLSPIDVEAPVG